MCGIVRREYALLHFRDQYVPNNLHGVFGRYAFAGDRNHGILLRQYHAVLAECTVRPVPAGRVEPKLVPVTITPAAVVFAVINMFCRCLCHPVAADNLVAVPNTILEIKLPEFGDVFGRHPQVGSAHVDALPVSAPGSVNNIQGII